MSSLTGCCRSNLFYVNWANVDIFEGGWGPARSAIRCRVHPRDV